MTPKYFKLYVKRGPFYLNDTTNDPSPNGTSVGANDTVIVGGGAKGGLRINGKAVVTLRRAGGKFHIRTAGRFGGGIGKPNKRRVAYKAGGVLNVSVLRRRNDPSQSSIYETKIKL